MLCGGDESETCCNHVDLSEVLSNWNKNTKKNVYAYLESYILLTKTIFNYYEDVIVLSKYVYLSPKSSKICKKSAYNLVKNLLRVFEIPTYDHQLGNNHTEPHRLES